MSQTASNPEVIRVQLRGVLESGCFRESERHRRLLEFLVETALAGKSGELKEFVIAAEVWGRDVSFDPRIHSTVRVEVSRLRARLDKYYASDGVEDTLRFRIPVGGYAVMFEAKDGVESAREPGVGGPPKGSSDATHFELLEMLGRGGMGEIRKARDTRLNRFVALKFIPQALTQNPGALERFQVEARAAAAINHPNICTVYDTGFLEGRPFLAMELLEGQTLRHRLQAGSIPLDSFLNWAIQITDGLDAAHASGIIHRDLKPANLFVTARDQAKILDFGLASLREMTQGFSPLESENSAGQAPTERIADATGVAGTLGYMSPEQTRGEHVDSRSDLFALGAVFYEILTGRPAFGDASALEIHQAALSRTPPAPSTLNAAVPAELDRIVLKALEKDRELRYQNAADLRADLRRLKRDSDSDGLGSQRPAGAVVASALVSRKAGWLRWVFVGSGAALLLLVGGWYWWQGRHAKLSGDGNLVLAEFGNTTGDPVFDAALRQGLAAQLEQSPYLGLISDTRIAQTMRLMAQPKDARLTPELARQVCERTGSAASIEGSIASLGSQYVLGLRALNCKSGDVLAEDQETANSKEQVLTALGSAASKLRRKLGESLPSLKRYDAPPEGVTTGSLPALEAYGLGEQEQGRGDCTAAVPHYERAIGLDPDFAMAYGRLGICYPERNKAEEATRKAYALRDRVSDRERFYIASHYEQYVTGDLGQALEILETWAQTYPHDGDPPANLVKLYLTTGDYDRALPLVQQMVRESPGTPVTNASRLGTTLLFLNRIDEAKTVLQTAVAQHHDGPVHHYYLYEIAFLQHDAAAMEREANYVRQQPGWAGNMLELESESAGYVGQFARARALDEQIEQFARREDDRDGQAASSAEQALVEALAGNESAAVTRARTALALAGNKDVGTLGGLALAVAGDEAGAARVAADLKKRFPADTIVEATSATIRAYGLLGGGKSQDGARRSVQALAETAPYEMGGTLWVVPVYARGQAYLAAGDTAKAAAEFQKILDHPGVTRNYVTGAVAHLGLARTLARAGEREKARAEYAAFLAIWHDADPDLPMLKAAKREFAELADGSH